MAKEFEKRKFDFCVEVYVISVLEKWKQLTRDGRSNCRVYFYQNENPLHWISIFVFVALCLPEQTKQITSSFHAPSKCGFHSVKNPTFLKRGFYFQTKKYVFKKRGYLWVTHVRNMGIHG